MNDNNATEYYSQIRTEIADLLPGNIGTLLDVGCGEGATAAWLKSQGICERACGIEFVPEAAAVARSRLDRLIEGNIEAIDLPIEESSVDVILCLDVLEHLVDPWRVAGQLQCLLKPGGMLLASIPNLRNLTVLAPLFFLGRWEYTEHGILDRTHLRFFTRQSAIGLLSNAGMQITAVKPLMGRYARPLNMLSATLFSGLLTKQYLIAARKPGPD